MPSCLAEWLHHFCIVVINKGSNGAAPLTFCMAIALDLSHSHGAYFFKTKIEKYLRIISVYVTMRREWINKTKTITFNVTLGVNECFSCTSLLTLWHKKSEMGFEIIHKCCQCIKILMLMVKRRISLSKMLATSAGGPSVMPSTWLNQNNNQKTSMEAYTSAKGEWRKEDPRANQSSGIREFQIQWEILSQKIRWRVIMNILCWPLTSTCT